MFSCFHQEVKEMRYSALFRIEGRYTLRDNPEERISHNNRYFTFRRVYSIENIS